MRSQLSKHLPLAISFGLLLFAQRPVLSQTSLGITPSVPTERWVSVGSFGVSLRGGDVISGQVNAIAVPPTDVGRLALAFGGRALGTPTGLCRI